MIVQHLSFSIALMMNSAILTQDVVSIQAPAVHFVQRNPNVFAFKSFHLTYESANCHLTSCFVSQSFLAQIDQIATTCNYKSYLEKFLTYPPLPAPFPLPGTSVEADPGCDVYTPIIEAALALNPAFDIYRIFDMV